MREGLTNSQWHGNAQIMHDSGGIISMMVAGWVLIVIEGGKQKPEKNSFSSLQSALTSSSHLGMAETSSD